MGTTQQIKNLDGNLSKPENPNYIVFVVNNHGVVESWPEQAEKGLGYKHDEIVGKHCNLFFEKKEIDSLITSVIDQGAISKNTHLKTQTGLSIDFNVTLNAIYNKHEQVLGFLVVLKPFEKSKTLGSKIRQKNISDPKTSMSQEDEQTLEDLRKEIELLSHALSHDLRGPLRAIDGYLKIIEEDYTNQLEPEVGRFIIQAQSNVKKMNSLIENLLTISRMATREVKISTINMMELVDEVVEDLKKEYPFESKIIINNLHPVNADYSLISIVFSQLLSNALKFSSQNNCPFIEVSSKEKDNEITYTVTDNGIGLDTSYTDRLFISPQKLHNLEDVDGTGMGLMIVKRVIDKHKGKLGVESELGKGSTFHFSLPNLNGFDT